MTSLWIKMPVALCFDFYYEMLFAGTPALAREKQRLGFTLRKTPLKADCLPLFLGSLPEMDNDKAFDLVMTYSPAIPNWSQMPGGDKREGMVAQFAPGLPGLKRRKGSLYVDNT